MEYLTYLQTTWEYLPYCYYPLLIYVFLTFIPKSLGKMKTFADDNYEKNRNKYHRCYGSENCCHNLLQQDNKQQQVATAKPKVRKAVTRVYPKRQVSSEEPYEPSGSKRASAKLLKVHVNEIAKMFENGNAAAANRKVNRVQPQTTTNNILPELRLSTSDYTEQELVEAFNNNKKFAALQQEQLENIENELNLCNRALEDEEEQLDINWRSEPIHIPNNTMPMPQKRHRSTIATAAMPPTILAFSDGTSATPSSGSPVDSLLDSPVLLRESTLSLPGRLNLKSSVEDIFAAIAQNAELGLAGDSQFKFAGCNTLAPVTSIDDILSERRLSRPLSAYSISDLLNEEVNQQQGNSRDGGVFVENLLRLSLK